MVTILSDLNSMELWATDIGKAYLEAYTAEELFIVAGPEFGELEGHMLIISKELYGLRTSRLRWHEHFSQCLRELGFEPCKAELDIWMRRVDDLYKYIAVYDNFRMNTHYGRYGATYNMIVFHCFNEELSLLPKNPTEAKLQATSTRGESTEPTKGVMKHTYRVVLYNYCLMQYCCILFYQLVRREGCIPNQWEKVSKSMNSSSIGNR
jgi:hypothetical protein